jgi:hypothetical protein
MAVANIEEEFDNDIRIARKHGNQVHRPTPAELKQWKAAAAPLADNSGTGRQVANKD